MAYDEELAGRIMDYFQARSDIEVKKMFGGLCFMLSEHMCCGIVKDLLMARVGADHYADCLTRPHATEMNFTGKAMQGMIYVASEGIQSEEQLKEWLDICVSFVSSLPPKKVKRRSR